MIWLAGWIGAMGIVCMLVRKTLLGILIGIQLLMMGSTMIFIFSGITAGLPVKGHVFALFITFGGMAQLIAACALVIRLFYLKNRTLK